MSTTPVRPQHRLRWSPESHLSRWTLTLAGLAVGGTVGIALAFAAGLEHGGSFTDNWFASLAGVAILANAVAATLTGLVAIFRRHEHSWVVVAATGLALLVDCGCRKPHPSWSQPSRSLGG